MTRMLGLILLLGALFPLPAFAALTINVPGAPNSSFAWTSIGTVAGDAWMLYNSQGNCHWWKLGNGGLSDDYVINMAGANDSVNVIDDTRVISCGGQHWMFSPLNANGHRLYVHGRYMNDHIRLGNTAGYGSRAIGDEHDDTLLLYNHGTAFGRSGNDRFYGDSSDNGFYGEGGDDRFCVHSWATIYLMDGSHNFDTRCGNALNKFNIEQVNCSVCGSGF